MNNNFSLIYGLEIEMEYNADLVGTIETGSYHSMEPPMLGNYWYCETDGSLSSNNYPNGKTIELISIPFTDNFKDILADLYYNIYRKVAKHKRISMAVAVENYKLSDIISFNSSCGAHVHFSLLNQNINDVSTIQFKDYDDRIFWGRQAEIKSFITAKFIKSFSSTLKRNIKKELPQVYPIWKQQYFRGYARRLRRDSDLLANRRTSEFNFTIPDNTRIEFRSFNLSGVVEWSQFFTIYKLLFESFNKCFMKEFNGESFCENSELMTYIGEGENCETISQEIEIGNDMEVE